MLPRAWRVLRRSACSKGSNAEVRIQSVVKIAVATDWIVTSALLQLSSIQALMRDLDAVKAPSELV